LRLDVRINLHLALGGDFVYEHDEQEEEATSS
jgi:hypothetical protein